MTLTDQTSALRNFGYSQSEAAFVAMAALHSGYFLARQFKENRGKAVARLCQKTVAFQHAKANVYGHRTTVYHLVAKPLYRALGQEDNRHRREHEPSRLRAKLMGFDYVLLNPGQRYLPTEAGKLDYFVGERNIGLDALPSKIYLGVTTGSTTRYFIEKFPIRIDPDTNRVSFCYVDTGVFAEIGLATFLRQYRGVITASAPSEVVYVSNSDSRFREAARAFAKAFPLAASGVSPALAAYFSERLDMETLGFQGRTQTQLDAYKTLSRQHASAQTEAAYAAWIQRRPSSDGTAPVTFSTYLLPFSYAFFGSPQRGK